MLIVRLSVEDALVAIDDNGLLAVEKVNEEETSSISLRTFPTRVYCYYDRN